MNCLKCGRETEGEQVFCPKCQAVMEKHPVPQQAEPRIPQRKESTVVRRAPKRKTVSPEEQVKVLKTRVIRMAIVLFLAVAIIVLILPSAISHMLEDKAKPGQNYSVVTTPAQTETQP